MFPYPFSFTSPTASGDDGFVMRVQTDIATASTGKSNDDQFLIKVNTTGYTFDYAVDWGDSKTVTLQEILLILMLVQEHTT